MFFSVNRMLAILFLGVVLHTVSVEAAAEPEINLLFEGTFKPVIMHGRPTAAYAWKLTDHARLSHQRNTGKYMSGEGCFSLDFQNGALTIAFPTPLNPAYVNQRLDFSSMISQPFPPAPEYLASGKIRFDRGKMLLNNRQTLTPGTDWQTFNATSKNPFSGFTIYPEAGAEFSVADLKSLAVYPHIGGEILLPGGGKLTRLLLPENASYLMRWSVALWRGWLWKITGTALPIESVKEIKASPGAFAAIQGKTTPGGWQLNIDKNGIVLTYGEELAIAPALFDFLRSLGYAYYARDCIIDLKSDPQRVLPLTAKEVKPRFRYYFPEGMGVAFMNGGIDGSNIFTCNLVDWFHLPSPVRDHILNVILPQEIYYKEHPEYFMMDRYGKRKLHDKPGDVNPCLSNPEAMRICTENLVAYALNQPERPDLLFFIGDGSGHCLCPECIKINHGTAAYSDLMMMLTNNVARILAKERPDMKIIYGPYASCQAIPVSIKPEENVVALYPTQHTLVPCALHVECEVNRKAYEKIAEWTEYMGGPDRMGVMTYRDMRPLHNAAQMDYMNQFIRREMFNWYWKGYSVALQFVTARWNLGEDPEKLLHEFNSNYYGKGGEFITEIDLLVKTFSAAYQHSEEEIKNAGTRHICIWGGDPSSRTALDRETFNKIYQHFDKALAAIDDADKTIRLRILKQKFLYLREDVNKYRRDTCANEAELAAFVERLVELIKIGREIGGGIFRNCCDHSTLSAITGMDIPNTGKPWYLEPELEKILNAPEPVKIFPMEPRKIPGGWYFEPIIFRGGSGVQKYSYQCPEKTASGIRRPSCGHDKITLRFKLDNAIDQAVFLILEGLDDDKKGASEFKITVNGKEIFSGPNSFSESLWSRITFELPEKILCAGDNAIELANITPETRHGSAQIGSADALDSSSSQWGWIMFSGAYLMNPNGEFSKLLSGEKTDAWSQRKEKINLPLGEIKAENGKLVITGTQAAQTGIWFFRSHKYPKIAVQPGMRLKYTAKASGKGELLLGYSAYSEKNGHLGFRLETFKLDDDAKDFTATMLVSKNTCFFCPVIFVSGQDQAVVESYQIEIIPKR
jgi:hypothetical protein